MTLSPLVERELRTGARRTPLLWLRGLLALILGAQCYDLLSRHEVSFAGSAGAISFSRASTVMTGSILLASMAQLLFVAVLLMGVLSADSISRERREGTLGLLLLTDLSPFQVVYGKMISCGLNSFLIFLGALPVLVLPVLIGGVNGRETVITGLGLLNALFVALAAGLWMSANFRERHHAVGMTLAVVAALGFGSEVLGGNWMGAGAVPLFRLLGLGGWKTLAQLPGLLSLLFVPWLVIMNSLGWLFLYFAGLSLSRNWQDKPHRQIREPEAPAEAWPPASPEEMDPANSSPNRPSWLTVPRPWDASPVGWRVERMGSIQGLLWLAVAISFVGQFCELGSGSARNSGLADTWGLMSFGGLVLVLFSGAFFAWAGARFFIDAKRQQDLELILTTSVGSRTVLSAQWEILFRALKFPAIVVLLIAVPSGISFFSALSSGYIHDRWTSFPTFIIPINLVLELVALCWMGMYCGLRAQTLAGAVLKAVALVQFVPFIVAGGVASAWDFLTETTASHTRIPVVVPLLLFLLAKNVAFIFWARLRLRRLLRLKQMKSGRNASLDRLVPQAA